ncbi:hypothetical protein Tco_0535148, partial [Tanacetum coccineum]
METEFDNDVKAGKWLLKVYDESVSGLKARGELIIELEKVKELQELK